MNQTFSERGLCVVPGCLDSDTALLWFSRLLVERPAATRIRKSAGQPIKESVGGLELVVDDGGPASHWVMDCETVRKFLPCMEYVYQTCRPLVALVCGQNVRLSPYERSRYTAMIYEPGDYLNGHHDTNSVTALLSLSCSAGFGTRVEGDFVDLGAGDLMVMDGRRMFHDVPAIPAGRFRVTIPMNYYLEGDDWRPEVVDRIIYGS